MGDKEKPRRGGLGGHNRDEAHINTNDCDARAERAQAILDKAIGWRELHPDAWRTFCDVLLDEADAGRRAPAKLAVEQVRRHSFASYPSIYSPISNSLAPALARLFIGQHPEAGQYVETRPSILDELSIDWSRA